MTQKQFILIIDDEEAVREAVADILDLESLPVLKAASGQEGVALFSQQQAEIALVILDLSMPGLSGHETLQQLQAINPDIPVLLSSGYNREDANSPTTNVKAAGFLQKPYNALLLIDTVMAYLSR
jgi:DNA-binding NtrC family response regulator